MLPRRGKNWFAAFFAGVLLLAGVPAFAGVISLELTDATSVHQEGDLVRVQGSLHMVNRGDEVAVETSVSLGIGQWMWAAVPKTLGPSQDVTWDIDETFPVEKLACQTGDSCAGLVLPSKGIFPRYLRRQYKDLNLYEFSFVEVGTVTIGSLTAEELARVGTPVVLAKASLDGDGDVFEGKVDIRNASSQAQKAALSFATSRQLVISTPPKVVSLDPDSVSSAEFSLKNYSALAGNMYPAYAVVQWDENGVRGTAIARTVAQIMRPEGSPVLLRLWAAGAACSLLLIVAIVILFRRNRRAS